MLFKLLCTRRKKLALGPGKEEMGKRGTKRKSTRLSWDRAGLATRKGSQ